MAAPPFIHGMPLMKVSSRDRLTILSVDGGGVRGLIPLQLLKFLEKELQNLDGEEARLADYFDLMAGTSIGGLIATMLATPDPNDHRHNRPYSIKRIEEFYLKNASSIFPQPSKWNPLQKLYSLFGPKFDGKRLIAILEQEGFHKIHLGDTVTKLVIPTFDITKQFPIIFATHEAEDDPLKNPSLMDVCLSTTAAPTYFPPHYFSTGKDTEFNLVDGGLAANNPTLLAMNIVTRAVYKDQCILDEKEKINHYIVLSLGTGLQDSAKWDAKSAAKWGPWKWIHNNGRIPLIESFMNASSDMVDIYLALMFAHCNENYLRIQECELTEDEAKMDLATDENLKNLVEKGQELLNEPVKNLDLQTGRPEVVTNERKNWMALKEMAERLSKEKKSRDKRSTSF